MASINNLLSTPRGGVPSPLVPTIFQVKDQKKNEVIGPHHSSQVFILKDVSLVYSTIFYGFFSNVSLFSFYHSFPHLKFLLEPTIYNQEALLKVAITQLKQKSSTNKCKEVVKNNFITNKQAKQTLILWKNND